MKKILFVCRGIMLYILWDRYGMVEGIEKGQFDLVEWVLFDSHTESVYEAEVTLYYNIRI